MLSLVEKLTLFKFIFAVVGGLFSAMCTAKVDPVAVFGVIGAVLSISSTVCSWYELKHQRIDDGIKASNKQEIKVQLALNLGENEGVILGGLQALQLLAENIDTNYFTNSEKRKIFKVMQPQFCSGERQLTQMKQQQGRTLLHDI
jgi:hypothetical protein